MWEKIKKHPGISLAIAFLAWLPTAWPVVSHDTIPEFVLKRWPGWAVMPPIWYRVFVVALGGAILLLGLILLKRTSAKRANSAEPSLDFEPPAVRIGPVEWRDLATQFKALQSSGVRADWSQTSAGERWHIGGVPGAANRECESLCVLAGTMLVASPYMSERLPSLIPSYTAPGKMWLFYLKEAHPLDFQIGLVGFEVTNDGSQGAAVCTGSIDNLAAVSARACIECAAAALVG